MPAPQIERSAANADVCLLFPCIRRYAAVTRVTAGSVNAPIERFFSSLKWEWTGDRLCQDQQKADADVREYMAVCSNSKRLHSTLGYQTLVNYEKRLNKVSEID